MSAVNRQALLDVPLAAAWGLVADPKRYAEWFPRSVEVEGATFDEGARFVQVFKQPLAGRQEAHFLIDTVNELREIRMHCTTSGLFIHWQLTDAGGGTFLNAEFGMDPVRRVDRLFDAVAGERFFRRWLDQAVDGLKRVTGE